MLIYADNPKASSQRKIRSSRGYGSRLKNDSMKTKLKKKKTNIDF